MRYVLTVIGMIICIPLVMLKKAFETNVSHHEIELVNYKNQQPFRLFFISDIHRRKISKRLIEQVGPEIDAVIIGGDLAEKGVPLMRIKKNIQKLAEIGPLYYVWGNNDREVGEQNIRKFIQQVGGKLLENESVYVETQNASVWIVGIDDVSSGRADIEKSFSGIPENETVIFVSHTPFVFNKVKKRYTPNILLAGHTHGGQIRLGKWGYYERGSLRKEQDVVTMTSNGYGTTLIPLRFGAPAECHVLTIKKTK